MNWLCKYCLIRGGINTHTHTHNVVFVGYIPTMKLRCGRFQNAAFLIFTFSWENLQFALTAAFSTMGLFKCFGVFQAGS